MSSNDSENGRSLRSGSVTSGARNDGSSTAVTSSATASGKKQRKKFPGEATLQRLLEEARYEIEVDPYRGITRYAVDPRGDAQRACTVTVSPWEYSCSWNVRNLHNDTDDNDVTEGSKLVKMACQNQCPCLTAWTNQQIQKKKSRKRKGSNGSSSGAATKGGLQPRKIGCRPKDAERCRCDYNPFCLGSVGGVMNDVWQQRLRALTSTENTPENSPQQRQRRQKPIAEAVPESSSPASDTEVIDLQDSAGEENNDESIGQLSADPDRSQPQTLYSKVTWTKLRELRRSTWIDKKKIRNHLTSTLQDLGKKFAPIDACMDRIEIWNMNLLFSNPLLEESNHRDGHMRVAIPPGIENLGATCYLNTQLQCLAQIHVFLKGIFSWRAPVTQNQDKMNEVLGLFQGIMASLHAGSQCTITTVEFSNALGLDHYEQQDPNEFSRLFFDLMHTAFQNEATGEPGGLPDLMNDVFQGMVKYQTICENCGQTSHRKEEFMDLNLPIVKRTDEEKPRKSGQQSILESLGPELDTDVQFLFDRYCRDEKLEGDNQYFCDQCGSKQNACRRVRFDKIPPLLNIQLSRYIYDMNTYTKKKVSEKVLLSLELNLESESEGSSKPTKHRYVLCAVMIHKGKSAYSGHYIAQCLDWTTGCWFEFNDTHVKILKDGPECSFDPTKEAKPKGVSGSEDAYNLYYVEESFLAQSIIERMKYLENAETLPSVLRDKAVARARVYTDLSR